MKKLFYGGYGDYQYYTVAESKEEAIKNIQTKHDMAFLPVEAELVDDINGFKIEIKDSEAKEKGLVDYDTSELLEELKVRGFAVTTDKETQSENDGTETTKTSEVTITNDGTSGGTSEEDSAGEGTGKDSRRKAKEQ